ncbi:crotonase/enoyl-CoA hydratase family protein [Yinghuangia sp. ASG 101]|uniref:crotonase/enoyl-CoA hydratase family protein n=1 Tax=Yinghuangia sp. ASG 101 TaxID=2896848 RepID=UPI001E41B8FA|nr:crotonase/enoyl-CoA hydratase family protein [Yinghuangia sp. ASG 101]UGQ11609.1 crotonase/enoyl-CoA hydratase family protein [Yinghuangia sp. ASG 101]
MTDAVQVTVDANIAVISLNRPEARNAADLPMARGVAEALRDLDARDDLAVGVLTGAGGTFCAGMDLKAFLAGELPMIPGRGFLGLVEAPPAKPLIAAVEGWALAGGCEAVLAADLVVAARTARFGLPEVKRGLIAAAGGLVRLPRAIPPAMAMELLLTGDTFDAERAHTLGLVNRLTEEGGALRGALELARTIAANGPLAVRATKQVVRESRDWPDSEVFDRQRAVVRPVFDSEDAQEGARAFAERRAPVWRGR